MKNLNILYLGSLSGTCLDRAHAYRRMGHQVTHIDLRKLLPSGKWIDRITWRIGGNLFTPILLPKLVDMLEGRLFDLCHVDNGEWTSDSMVRFLRKYCRKIINYNIDDPTGGRDFRRFHAYCLALPEYDLAAVVREENIKEAYALGARRVIRVWRSADEVSHAPRFLDDGIKNKWSSNVLFLGTWMPERGPFLSKLLDLGVPLTIQGENWRKAPEWPKLRASWRGGAISGDDYAYAIQCAKVNLGLLSKGNRDLHTTRSLEIPALGGLLCAERTSEHLAMYEEGREAIFWSDPEECARSCKMLLEDEATRRLIAIEGKKRFIKNKNGNQDVLQHILETLFEGENASLSGSCKGIE